MHSSDQSVVNDVLWSSRDVPAELIRTAVALAVEQDFVREKWECEIHLDIVQIGLPGKEIKEFISLECMTNYSIKNICKSPKYFEPAVFLSAVRHKELKKYVKIENLFISKKGGFYRQYDLSAANCDLQNRITEHRTLVSFDKQIVNPGEIINIALHYSKIKEISDTEILASQYPANSIIFTLVDKTNGKLFMDAAAIGMLEVEAEAVPLPQSNAKNSPLIRFCSRARGFSFGGERSDPHAC